MLRIKQAALLLAVLVLAGAAVGYVLVRPDGFGDLAWWLVTFLWIDVIVLALVLNAKWKREAESLNAPGGFEVLSHDDNP
jgi:uncharacterized membrane protein YoaK (UPF0700 family)